MNFQFVPQTAPTSPQLLSNNPANRFSASNTRSTHGTEEPREAYDTSFLNRNATTSYGHKRRKVPST
jgi:hypothetical protein